MRYRHICFLLSSLLLIVLTGCKKKNAGHSQYAQIKAQKLKKYHTVIPNNNLVTGLPVRVKYHDNHLFIEDLGRQRIVEINDSNKVVNTFGRKGRGPGEDVDIENFFITKKHFL